eukprot:TRINITY_DN16434_c0_g1_i1.p1 TRINITY_DN16434_c0_g1~~TRINITY_DN16434_c0_g1_i1.p1  ORF type:complete len:150 (-),score=20.22 TRINITY_DN16434_c0_g1_i1:284-733(-)
MHFLTKGCKCQTYQVQQQKKAKNWVCKICRQKQTLMKIYATSYKASDIRPIVQDYNMQRGKREEAAREKLRNQSSSEDSSEDSGSESSDATETKAAPSKPKISKWNAFLDNHHTESSVRTLLLPCLIESHIILIFARAMVKKSAMVRSS